MTAAGYPVFCRFNVFLKFTLICLFSQVLVSSIDVQSEVSTTGSEPNSPSPNNTNTTTGDETGHASNLLLLPPSLVKVTSGVRKHYRNLKNLMRQKKPVYEDFLDQSQQRVLEAAVKHFGLFYSLFRNFNYKNAVKQGSGFDLNESTEDEADQIRAFELLCGIVGRSVRDIVICSSNNVNSTARKQINCDYPEEVLVFLTTDADAENDDLCSSTNLDKASSEECERIKEGREKQSIKVIRGPPLDFTVTVLSTSRSSTPIRLPSNGALKDAVDRQLWKANGPTKIILTLAPHEFMREATLVDQMNRKMIEAFTKHYGSNEIHNIVLIEWPEIYAKRLSITQLASRYMATAEKLARIFLRWHNTKQIQLDQTHIIGTSMGAHLAGVLGDIIKKKTEGQQVSRITGLDPIGWGFDEMDGIGVDPELELSKEDAQFVDVIHTSTPDPTYPYIRYGSMEKRGTVDFYPNNGRAQYCGKTDGLCHHFYSVNLYTASITGTNFNGCKCFSWDDFIIKRKCFPCMESAKMGEHVDKGKANGVYYLVTA